MGKMKANMMWLSCLALVVLSQYSQRNIGVCHGWSTTPSLSSFTKLFPNNYDNVAMMSQRRRSHGRYQMSAMEDVSSSSTLLSSTYDVSLPASLRGEAVRSALRSDRGVCYNLSCTKMPERNVEVLRLKGKGTMSFLNSKLSSSFSSASSTFGTFQKTLLVSSKGHVTDVLTVLLISPEEAILMTSPGNDSLYQQLEPLIFPMDQVKLTKMMNAQVIVLGTANTDMTHLETSIQTFVAPLLKEATMSFPSSSSSSSHFVSGVHAPTSMDWFLLPDTFLPKCSVKGYTFLFLPPDKDPEASVNVANSIWNKLIAEDNMEGPVHLGPLEYETLRIEAGQPAYGYEMKKGTKHAPTELHFHESPMNLLKDATTKGCFLGQEAVSAALGNPRGPPRSLYSLVFQNEQNTYYFENDQGPTYSTSTKIDNLTRLPQVNDTLYVLGSNEQISVGKITSVGEMGGTSNDEIVCLALIKRAESIRKQMKGMDMEDWDPYFDMHNFDDDAADDDSSGILPPPPRDPLHGLEVIIGGTMTYGTLRVLPWRRLIYDGQNIFQEGTWDTPNQGFDDESSSSVMGFVPTPGIVEEAQNFSRQVTGESTALSTQPIDVKNDESIDTKMDTDDDDDASLQKAVEQAEKDAQKAADEAKRKEEKLKLLKQRAEAALEARRKKKEEAENAKKVTDEPTMSEKEAEAKRKEEKLKLLKQRADAAMAARKNKKKQS